jgi:hypothetical protein
MIGATLTGADLRGVTLIHTHLSYAILTGAYLYGTARDNWQIDGVTCNWVYWDEYKEVRVPKDRDFRPGEFEELYKQLPSFEYYFEQGFTPLDPLIMDQVVQAINKRRPDIELKIATFDARGQAHVTFTVLHQDYTEDALKEVTAGYEMRLKILEGQNNQLMDVIKMLGSGNVMLQPADGGINLRQALSPDLMQQIVAFLSSLPGLETEGMRRAWLHSAGLDAALQQHIQVGGPPIQFFNYWYKHSSATAR